ncbi:exported hypothetical protein [Candidatus Desulfosporosinus infrequens]|uniref:DUF3494 domain-containing protein n=1 Tax=Candidatus Desulfosporosinus infrequens TaxID=2043169 RepID=A0A2U3K3Q1_9FIRM|nr:exported hypothetical protein [Candidatus Desulfosporosinus infrequens]
MFISKGLKALGGAIIPILIFSQTVMATPVTIAFQNAPGQVASVDYLNALATPAMKTALTADLTANELANLPIFVLDSNGSVINYEAALAKSEGYPVALTDTTVQVPTVPGATYQMDADGTLSIVSQVVTIASVSAVNGTVSVTLSSAPTVTPVPTDFVVKQSINGAPATTVTPPLKMNGVVATFTDDVVPATTASQSVVYSVSYKGGASISAPAFVVSAGVNANIGSAADLATALADPSVTSITFTASLSASPNITRPLTMNLGAYILIGDVSFNYTGTGTSVLTGNAGTRITGNLTVNTANASFKNGVGVGGTVNVVNVQVGTWTESADGNTLTITDPDGAVITVTGNPGSVTVAEGSGGSLTLNVNAGGTVSNITSNAPVNIVVATGATVSNITSAAGSAGTTITNNGTTGSVTADVQTNIVVGTSGTVTNITTAAGASGSTITNNGTTGTVTANVQTNIVVGTSGIVTNITAAAGSDGSTITNNGTTGTVTADVPINLVANVPPTNTVTSGSGTVAVTGTGASTVVVTPTAPVVTPPPYSYSPPAITTVTSSDFTTTSLNNTATITLTGGTFKAGTIAASDFTFGGTDAAALALGTFTRVSNTVLTITGLSGLTGVNDTVLVKAATQATQATSVAAVASTTITTVTSPTFTLLSANDTATITLTGGTFKAGTIAASDFTFGGTDAAALALGTFTRVSNTVVTITGLSGLTGVNDTILVKAATQVTQAASVAAVASTVIAAAPVNLGTAGNYAILSKAGISSVPNSVITGDIAVSPAAATYITGFSLSEDASNAFSTSTQVTGKVYAATYAVPTPSDLTIAVNDMGTAYTDAAGRAANYTELYTGDISGKTLTPGVYKWSTGVLINSDVTLHGGANDVFIFEIAGGITQANDTHIILTGGAQAKNIFWQSADTVAIGTGAHFEGIVLGMTNISMGTNASINGRLLAQTAVTLDESTVVAPSALNSIALQTATAAVGVAEVSKLQADVAAAQVLVTALPADVAPATAKADLQARLAAIVVAPAAVTAVSSPAFTTSAGNTTVTITLTGGTLKAGPLVASDFTFAGTDNAVLAAATTFTRTSATVVTITGIGVLTGGADNTVLVKAATQTSQAASVVGVASASTAVGTAAATEGTSTIAYTLTTGTFAPAATTIDNWTIAGADAGDLGAITGVVLNGANTVATITVTNPIGANTKVYTAAPAQAAFATGFTAPASAAAVSITTAGVTSPVFITTSANNTATITLTGGIFKTGVIAATDFIFDGTNATALADGTFTRTSDTSVTITGLTLVGGTNNTVLVKAATQATQAASVTAVASTMIATAPVNLGTAGNYAILSKAGISSVSPSVITGDLAVSPAAATYITGFSLSEDASDEFSTSSQVIGNVYAADYAVPTPSNLTTAVSDMGTAYTDAAGRAANYTELYSGDISGQTLTPGVYKWSTDVQINSDVTLNGGANDVFIFETSGKITQANSTNISLTGGAQAKNIFWQSAGSVTIGTSAHFEGIVLGMTNISMETHASIDGRLLAQTAVTLDKCTITAPAPTVALSSDASIATVFGQAISAGAEAGTIGAPKTASINVVTGVATVSAGDVVKTDPEATVTFYGTNSAFTTTTSGAINLIAGGPTVVYVKVTAANASTLYYAVTIIRAAALVTYASTGTLTHATVSETNGTRESDAIASLDTTVGVVATSSEPGTATIAWTIAGYSASGAGNYTATGVVTLPAGWTGPVANVTATVTVTP